MNALTGGKITQSRIAAAYERVQRRKQQKGARLEETLAGLKVDKAFKVAPSYDPFEVLKGLLREEVEKRFTDSYWFGKATISAQTLRGRYEVTIDAKNRRYRIRVEDLGISPTIMPEPDDDDE